MEHNETIRDQTGIARQRVMAHLFVGAGLTLFYAFTRGTTWQGSATLHTVMEAIATLLLLSVLAWLREQRLGDAGRIGERPVYPFAGALGEKAYAQ